MYCEDSAADEVEHHRPKDLYPEHVFVWENYLYVCGPCNGPKNNRFAVIAADGSIVDVSRKRNQPGFLPGAPAALKPPAAGDPVLLHPRVEDALDYMMLDILGDTFLFVPTAASPSRKFDRATYTIELLRLNHRDYLQAARRGAYGNYQARLFEYVHRREAGAGALELRRMISVIRDEEHPTVWSEMRRQNHLGAATLERQPSSIDSTC